MFSALKPRIGAARSKPQSAFGKLYEHTMEQAIETDYGRGPEFRPSSFPTCPILTMTRLQVGAHYKKFVGEMSASGGFFTSVGTAAHENIQYFIGASGKIWGDWKCINPRCKKAHAARDLYDEDGNIIRKGKLTRRNTTNNKCPCCKHDLFYEEKEVRYKGLKGHIDAILKTPEGFIIGDYKTTTRSKLESGKLPMKAHLKQLPTYCYILKKKYKMKVIGFSLLYFSRDNPFRFVEHYEPWTDEWDERVRTKVIKHERKKFKAGVKAFLEQDIRIAIKHKPCSCREQYEEELDFYTPCPLLGVCFKPDKLTKRLTQFMLEHPPSKAGTKFALERIPAELL
jgi:hypothetical protein